MSEAPLIFLGAGASSPFGIPTMKEMVSKFEDHLKKENIQGAYLYSDVKNMLSKEFPESNVDIESIFSVIDGIARQITPKQMGTYPYYYIRRFSSENKFSDSQIEEAQNLKNELEKFIKKECEFQGENKELSDIYERSYEIFFRNLPNTTRRTNKDGLEFSYPWRCYTTNYDLVFENFWRELDSISDFFEGQGNRIRTFNPNKELQGSSFVKLHGSIDWEKLEDGNIIQSSPTSSFTRRAKQGAAMLYPIQQKDLYLHPWITLFQEFKQGLKECNLWYVVGYAFNDEFILNAINESFNESKKMILINPEALEIYKKFPKKIQSNIEPIPIKFGDEYFFEDFHDFSRGERTIEVEINAKAHRFGIVIPLKTKIIEILERDNVSNPEVIHSDNTTKIVFLTDSDKDKKVVIKLTMKGFKITDDSLEFKTFSIERDLIHVNLRNQDRLIDAFTNQNQIDDSNDEYFYGSTNVDCLRFYKFR